MRGGLFLIQFLATTAIAAAFVAPTGLAFVPATTTIPPRRPSPFSPQAGPRRASRLWCELCGDDGKRHDDDDRGEELDVTGSSSLFAPATEDDDARNPVPPPVEGKEPAALGGAMINFIKGYKQLVSPILPPACRFLPTCSEYAMEAIKEFGPSKGAVLTAWRILRCNPFGGRGYDPPVWPPPPWDAGSTSRSR